MMQLEVWSDFLCPFCFIGKRRLEQALALFEHRDQVQVMWKSFQLDSEAELNPGINTYEMLANKYRRTPEQAREMTRSVSAMADTVGLKLDFDKAVLTNSFDAHRLAHLAAKHGKQDAMQERLFKAHFAEGLHIGDRAVLEKIGIEVGLDADAVRSMLASEIYGDEVRSDCSEAEQIGATGVPLFVIDRRFGISGAQPLEVFMRALNDAWAAKG